MARMVYKKRSGLKYNRFTLTQFELNIFLTTFLVENQSLNSEIREK